MILYKFTEIISNNCPIRVEEIEVEEKPTCYVHGYQRISKASINTLQGGRQGRYYMYCVNNDSSLFIDAKIQSINSDIKAKGDYINRINKEIHECSEEIQKCKSKLLEWQGIKDKLKSLEQDRRNVELINTLIANFESESASEQKIYLKSYIPVLTTIMEVLTNQSFMDTVRAVET